MVEQQTDGAVEFRLFRPGARGVSLAGDFNGWQTDVMPMERADGDWWVYRLRLMPGIYQFKYVMDGAWLPDYAAFGLELGVYGWNSVVFVRDSAQSQARPVRSEDRSSFRIGARNSLKSSSCTREERVAVGTSPS